MKRRLLMAAAAVAAGGAGLGTALWQRRQASGEQAAAAAAAGLAPWNLRFTQPGGGELIFAGLLGKPLVLNFWATWCPPCVHELPELDRFHLDHQTDGWQVVGLAVDGPTPVREFLAKQPLSFPVGLAGLEGTELSRALGNERGGLPFTVVFDRSGQARQRKAGQTHYGELVEWAKAVG